MRVLRIPDAADVAERLETVEGNAALGEGLGHGEPAGPGADDAITRHVFTLGETGFRRD